jgi:hypothetical protein
MFFLSEGEGDRQNSVGTGTGTGTGIVQKYAFVYLYCIIYSLGQLFTVKFFLSVCTNSATFRSVYTFNCFYRYRYFKITESTGTGMELHSVIEPTTLLYEPCILYLMEHVCSGTGSEYIFGSLPVPVANKRCYNGNK